MTQTKVSLCMIVRDEARMIDDCLASVQGFVSERIVVDTGSTDDTRERARRHGATVFDVPWQDDFAHARNASLAHATGDWVLILDADERLVPADFDRVRELLGAAAFDCGLPRLHDAVSLGSREADVVSGKERQGTFGRAPRLVRRRPDIRYVGVIHEDLGPWMFKHKGAFAPVDLDIVHYGGVRELQEKSGKADRNVRLLSRLAESAPEDPTALAYLAWHHMQSGDLVEARKAADAGWRRVHHVEASTGYRVSVLRLAVARAELQLRAGDARGALETVQRARGIEGPHHDLEFLAGYASEQLCAPERDPEERWRVLEAARACFARCIAAAELPHWYSFVEGATGWAAWTRTGSIDLLLGDLARARQAFETALRLRPGALEARLGILEVTLRADGPREGLALAAGLMNDPAVGATRDAWVLAAEACEAVGAIDDMARLLDQARTRKPEYVAAHRRTLHADRVAALALYRGKPAAGPGLVGAIGALAAGQPTAPSEAGAWRSSLAIVRVLVRNLAHAGHASLLEPLVAPGADAAVPGLAEHVRQAAGEEGVALASGDGSPRREF